MDNMNLIVFFDAIGRTIIGEASEKTDEKTLYVTNPAVVSIGNGAQPGQMTLQLFPAFFREFLGDKSQRITWGYPRAQVTETTDKVAFDFRLEQQYIQLFQFATGATVEPEAAAAAAAATTTAKVEDNTEPSNVIKLFDKKS